ncbi:tRNA-uridine aminocarboxypropyltransferase [Massilia antarctica]|nr:DTW domain-containing protein [Massilia antarctica]
MRQDRGHAMLRPEVRTLALDGQSRELVGDPVGEGGRARTAAGPVNGCAQQEQAGPARRKVCAHCARPAAACICRWISPVESAVRLLILQHPMEVSNAKGSARLLHLSVAGSRLVAGEVFDPAQLGDLLAAEGRRAVLLYPDTPDDRSLGMPAPPPLPPELLHSPGQLLLVVLDGTWRKSRKMLYLNPLLHALPRLPLNGMPPSRYRIRKAHAPDQLSTLEATCHALGEIEGDHEKFLPLSRAFDDLIDAFVLHQGRL